MRIAGEVPRGSGQPPASFGFTQAGVELQGRWLEVAERVRARYSATDEAARLRFARRGTSISTAAALDQLVEDLLLPVVLEDSRDDPDVALELLHSAEALRRLLALPEASNWRFKTTRTGPIVLVEVDPDELLAAWLNGESPEAMSDRFLAEVSRRDWAIEQIVDALTAHFEVYLSWMLGSIFESLNQRFGETELTPLLCPSMPAFVRYGVKSTVALELLTRGIRSRQLANAIAVAAEASDVEITSLSDWIGAMSIPEWRARFDATPGDILDLLDYARRTGSRAVIELLEQRQTTLSADLPVSLEEPVAVIVRSIQTDPVPQRLGIFDRETGDLLAEVPAPIHNEVENLLDTGLAEEILLADHESLVFRTSSG